MAAVTISVCLQKGGVGKSTTAQNLAAILGAKGNRVLLVDCDGQANVSLASGITSADKATSFVLSQECTIQDAIIPLALFYDLVPSDMSLANFETIEGFEADHLHAALDGIRDKYDFIVLDSPPSLGNILKNVLFASDFVIIPVDPRPFALHGIDDLQDTLQVVQSATGRAKVLGLLMVRYNNRTVLSKNMDVLAGEIAAEMGTSVFDTKIRESIAVGEAQTVGKPLIEYAPKASVTSDYINLADEVIKRIRG